MTESKEKLSDDNESGEKKNIPPLNLNTPDLTPKERELLMGAQIDRMFEEDLNLRNSANEFPPLQPGEKVPKEEEVVQIARQKQIKEDRPVSPEDIKLIAFADEFRRMPEKINLFADWLMEVTENLSNQVKSFQSMPQEKQREMKSIVQSVERIQSVEKNLVAPDNAAIMDMANTVNKWIHALRESGVPSSALSRNAFHAWLNARNMGQEGAAGI